MLSSRVSYKLVQRLLGHAMTVCVLNRCGMPIFRKLYDFVESQQGPRKLFDSELAEVRNFVGILPLLVADMKRPWSDVLTATDASPEGFGIVESCIEPGEARCLGAWSERFRFKRLPVEEWAPRKRAVPRDVFGDVVTVIGNSGLSTNEGFIDNSDFPEVSKDLLNEEKWHTVKMGKWADRSDSITIKEGRALVIALRRLARSSVRRNKNHVILLDNLALSFAVTKGRAHNYSMLRILQQVGSLCLAARLGIFPRWVPSEFNPADGPSRGQLRAGAHSKAVSGKEDQRCQTKGPYTGSEEGEVRDTFPAASSDGGEEEGSCQEVACAGEKVRCEADQAEGAQVGASRSKSSCGQRGLGQIVPAGNEECLTGGAGAVRGLLQQVQGLLPGERSKVASGQRYSRRCAVRVPRFDVRARTIPARRGKEHRCNGVFQNGPEGVSGEMSSRYERMEKSHAGSTPSHHVWPGNGPSGAGQACYGLNDCPGIRLLSEARRSLRPEGEECSSPCPSGRQTVQVGHHSGQRSRGQEARQNRRVRQFHSHRQGPVAVAWSRIAECKKGLEQHRRSPFHIHHGGVQSRICPFRKKVEPRSAAPIPIETRGGDGRFVLPLSRSQRCQVARPLENRQFCEKICKDRQSTGASDSVRATADQLLQVGRDISGEMLPRPSASTPCIADFPDVLSMRNKKHLFALEIFAGTARVSQALAQIGHTMYPLDICIFPSHNVLDPHVEGKILSWISSGRVWLVWLGMPCTTFSCARKNDGKGPGPLRDSEHLWGLAGLPARDRHKLCEGNALFYFTLRVLQTCAALNIPFVLENPLSSMVWELPPMRRFMHDYDVGICDLDYCQFGELWKKPTRLAYKFIKLDSLSRRCSGIHGICNRSQQPHERLTGVNANNVFKTLVAQPYPWELCHAFARVASTLRG